MEKRIEEREKKKKMGKGEKKHRNFDRDVLLKKTNVPPSEEPNEIVENAGIGGPTGMNHFRPNWDHART